ncbi:MAG: chloride channel protein [Bacteroidales bacterium]|nr:chloride channel protein [Bacteroidales bacterium]
MSMRFYAKLVLFKRWLKEKSRYRAFIILLSIIIGLVVGVAASLMKTLVLFIKDFIISQMAADHSNPLFFVLPIIGILLTIAFMKWIIRDDVRHGIPRILYVLSNKKGHMQKHKTFSSFVGGAITAAFGGSAGLESPIISTGAATGSYLSQLLRLDFKTTSLLIGCGAAGAISSIFYTPIAAVIFAIEVLMLDLTTVSIIPLLITTITGATTANLLMPQEALFQFSITEFMDASEIPLLIFLGVITGLLSVYFNRVSHGIQRLLNHPKKVWVYRTIGLLSLGLLIYLFPPLYGEGYDTLKSVMIDGSDEIMQLSLFQAFSDKYWIIIAFLFFLVMLKVITTTLTIETGGVGGIFAPAVFTGGTIGYIFASIGNKVFSGLNLSGESYAIVGMAGVLGGVLHAPLTAIFFAAEITNGYTLMLPLMLVTAIAFATNLLFERHSIFTRQLAEQGRLLTHHKDQNVLTLLPLSSVIDKDFTTINPDCTLGDLTKIISKSHRNIYPVVDSENNFLGVITLDEVREDMFDTSLHHKPVKSYVIQPLDKVGSQDSMEDVMKKFNETHYYNLPVIDDGKYVGFVSRSNTFLAYRKTLLDITMD